MNRSKTKNAVMAAGLTVAFLLAVLPAALPAQRPPDFMKVKQFLNLTDAQFEKLMELRQNFERFVRPRHEALAQLDRQLHQSLASGQATAASAGEIILKQHTLRQEIAAANAQKFQAFMGMLEKEQADKMGAIRMAALVEPIFDAFKHLGLVPPPPPPPQK